MLKRHLPLARAGRRSPEASQERGSRRRNQAGISLVELLLAMVIGAFLAGAVAFSINTEVRTERALEARQAKQASEDAVEDQITQLLKGTKLTTTDTTTFFQAVDDGTGGSLGVGRITFTTSSLGVPMKSLYSTDDSETQQTEYGPVGGIAEVSLGTAPVGSAPGQETGLFERLQNPSDADPTQGGNEWLLDADISQIGFQFWDGQEWIQAWDTTTATTKLLPEAVQVSYTLRNDTTNTTHMFVVPLLTSTVTPNNPAPEGGTS